MSAHSNVVGGSSASRFIGCPGSRAIIDSMPDAVDLPSSYATEGSALHQVVAEILLNDDRGPADYLDVEIIVKDEGAVRITQELISDCVEPCLDWYDKNIPETAIVKVEQRVAFPGIEGAFGTGDLLACDRPTKRSFVTDWKMGAGIFVAAAKPDPDDPEYEIVNAQLLFYACAARHSLPDLFPSDHRIVLTIVQPRIYNESNAPTTVTVDHADLDAFERDLAAAMDLSMRPDAPLKLGDYCRFAICRTKCPLQLAPLLDFTDIPELHSFTAPKKGQTVAAMTEELLADIMNLAELIEPLVIEARRQAHALLEGGGEIPGYKLVPKRAQRKWLMDQAATLKGLRKLKINKAQALVYDLKTPAQIEKLLPKGTEIPPALISKISSGTTLAKESDPRPDAPDVGSSIAEIVNALGR